MVLVSSIKMHWSLIRAAIPVSGRSISPKCCSGSNTAGVWVRSLLRRKAPTPIIANEINRINDIMEADTMLAERIEGWFEEATQKGRQQGVQLGEARMLVRLLRHRFGELPDWVDDKLAAASPAQLEAWADAAWAANSLDEVFAGPAPADH